MQKEVKEALRIRFKLAVLEYSREIGSARNNRGIQYLFPDLFHC
jgi:hypothetical protein